LTESETILASVDRDQSRTPGDGFEEALFAVSRADRK
jgi:hypothetical protein